MSIHGSITGSRLCAVIEVDQCTSIVGCIDAYTRNYNRVAVMRGYQNPTLFICRLPRMRMWRQIIVLNLS